jgi:peptidoglycan/LPS O-acetylase OafA/YrhL
LAVDLFFLLSGLVLARAYNDRFRKGMSAGKFMLLRLIRLYPLYILGTVLVAAYFSANIILEKYNESFSHVAVAFTLAMFYLPTPSSILVAETSVFPFLYPAWSLFFELIANAIFGVARATFNNSKLTILVILAAIALVWSAFHYGELNVGFDWKTFPGGMIRVVFSFFCGVLLQSVEMRWRGRGIHAALCILAAVLIFLTPVRTDFRPYFDLTVVIIIFPALTLISASSEGGPLMRSALIWLGDTSYAIYTLHIGTLWWTIGIASRLFHTQLKFYAPISGICFLAFITAIAVLADKYYDRPARKLLVNRTYSGLAVVGLIKNKF